MCIRLIRNRPVFLGLLIALTLAACAPAHPSTDLSGLNPTPQVSTTIEDMVATSNPVPSLQVDHHPLYWFAPLPPQPLGPYNGSDDYMKLFEPGAEWEEAASEIQVFKLYGGWAATDATVSMLSQAIEGIRQRGLALAVELGPLNEDATCGLYIEGFAGRQGVNTVNRIEASGGDLNFIALDEPYYWAHFYDGDQACNWSTERIAKDVGTFIAQVRKIFPDVVVGDIEPVTGPADAAAYKEWLETFRAVNGYDLAFLHLDMDWSNSSWPQEALAMEAYGRELGIPIGIIYIGNFHEDSDASWMAVTGERVKLYELQSGGQPDHVIFQSWTDRPDRALPESERNTWTWFMKTYFEDRSSLKYKPIELLDKLALNKEIRVSRFASGNEGQYAVDGDTGTVWNAGDDAPQWIEIDLGAEHRIGEIRLLVSQYPEGQTSHHILGKGSGYGDQFSEMAAFNGFTQDGQWLTAAGDWPGIRYVRIETLASPSWVSWREIELAPAD
jgi:hypothetical protein